MRAQEFVDEDLTRRGFLRGLGAAAAAGATGGALAQAQPVDASKEFQNMRRDDPRVRHAQDINDLAKAIYQNMVAERGQPADRREQNKWMEIAHLKAEARFAQYKPGAQTATKPTAGFSSQGSEYRRARDIDNFESVTERKKSRRKKSSRHGGYFFPGYGYYGGGDGGEGGGDGGGGESRSSMAEGNDKEQAVRRIQKMLNDRFDANLDIDGVMGPLTQKSINRFMPRARPGSADEPNRTTAVQGKKVKTDNMAEAFDQPYKTKSEKSDYGDVDMLAKLPDGTNLSIMFNQEYGDEGEEVVQVEFYRNNSQEVTGEGDAQRIFATVIDAIQKYIKKYKPQRLSFSASKAVDMDADDNGANFNPESRAKLYDRLVQRYSKALGYRAFRADNGDIVIYELSRIKPGVAEEQLDELNFLGSECTKDCSGHRAGYDWSKRKGLRQANSWSPSFNKGAGLAVAGK